LRGFGARRGREKRDESGDEGGFEREGRWRRRQQRRQAVLRETFDENSSLSTFESFAPSESLFSGFPGIQSAETKE